MGEKIIYINLISLLHVLTNTIPFSISKYYFSTSNSWDIDEVFGFVIVLMFVTGFLLWKMIHAYPFDVVTASRCNLNQAHFLIIKIPTAYLAYLTHSEKPDHFLI